MKVFMLIVAAMALAPRLSAATAAACTLPTTLQFGTATGGTENSLVGCIAGAPLADDTSCNLKKVDGYTAATEIGTYSCPAGAATVPTTAMAATGCDTHYYHSAGTSAADLECTLCPIGKTKAILAGFTAGTAADCTDCVPATAGSCSTGCPANHYQASGKTVDKIICTACVKDGETKAAAVHDDAGTTACDAAPATESNATAAAAAAAAAAAGVGAAASSAAVAVLLASFY